MKKMYFYPKWLRFWHWTNALLFIILIVTGISMHYSTQSNLFLPFDIAMVSHNVAGILLTVLYIFYAIMNAVSGNYKHYIPKLKGLTRRMIVQARYYVYGVFRGEPHPYEISEENKFNPLQKLTYFSIMFIFVPVICISGVLLLFPEFAPEDIAGMGGVWPMAVLHAVVGYILSVFMFGHIYLATHGETVTSNFKSMFTGYHIEHEEHEEHVDMEEELIKDMENKE